VGPRARAVRSTAPGPLRGAPAAPLAPRLAPPTAVVRGLALPDSTPVAVRARYTPAVFDSIQARARAVQDSLNRLRDTTARKDTTARRDTSRVRPTPPSAAAQRAPAAPGVIGRAARDTTVH